MTQRSQNESARFNKTGSRTELTPQLTDKQWLLIEDLFPDKTVSVKGGRPPRLNRDCFEGILFVLITGARWKDLPDQYPSKSVCHQRFQQWVEEGLFQLAWQRLLKLEKSLKQIDLTILIGDGTFVPAKKGVAA